MRYFDDPEIRTIVVTGPNAMAKADELADEYLKGGTANADHCSYDTFFNQSFAKARMEGMDMFGISECPKNAFDMPHGHILTTGPDATWVVVPKGEDGRTIKLPKFIICGEEIDMPEDMRRIIHIDSSLDEVPLHERLAKAPPDAVVECSKEELDNYIKCQPLGEIIPDLEEGMKFDTDKLRYDLTPAQALEEMVKVLTFGAEKYAPNNWQRVSDPLNRYFAAAMRHLIAWRKGESTDPETGLPHIAHAMCCLAFIVELEHES